MSGKQAEDSKTVRQADRAVLWITCGSTAAALALSYRNQVDFASQRGHYPAWAALIFPLIIDSPVIVGELRLYSAVMRREAARIKAWAWLLTGLGLVISMAFGAAHVSLPLWFPAEQLAAAVAPLAAAASLGTGLGIVKLNADKPARETRQTSDSDTAPARQPGKQARRKPAGNMTVPSYAQLAALAAKDEQDHKPMGRRAFATRHSISQHHARVFLGSRQNGGESHE